MAEVALVDEHVNGCMVCHAVAGPFIVFAVDNLVVHTVEGPMAVPAELTLCAPRENREGCAGQSARTAGYVPPAELEQALTQLRESYVRAETLEIRNGELEQAQNLREDEFAKKVAAKIIEEASAA